MAQFTIPLENNRNFSFLVKLDGPQFLIRMRWNVRDEAFYMDILDDQNDPVILGKRLSRNVAALGSVTRENRPQGSLVFVENGNKVTEATPETLGISHELVYVDLEGVRAALSA